MGGALGGGVLGGGLGWLLWSVAGAGRLMNQDLGGVRGVAVGTGFTLAVYGFMLGAWWGARTGSMANAVFGGMVGLVVGAVAGSFVGAIFGWREG